MNEDVRSLIVCPRISVTYFIYSDNKNIAAQIEQMDNFLPAYCTHELLKCDIKKLAINNYPWLFYEHAFFKNRALDVLKGCNIPEKVQFTQVNLVVKQ